MRTIDICSEGVFDRIYLLYGLLWLRPFPNANASSIPCGGNARNGILPAMVTDSQLYDRNDRCDQVLSNVLITREITVDLMLYSTC